jgi:hypothetical protein
MLNAGVEPIIRRRVVNSGPTGSPTHCCALRQDRKLSASTLLGGVPYHHVPDESEKVGRLKNFEIGIELDPGYKTVGLHAN